MINFYDITRMYSTTTGDSDIELSTAVPGCKTFAQAGIADSQEINYGIVTFNLTTHRPVGMEVGTGKYNSSDSNGGPYLRRTSVISSILSSDSAEDVNIDLTGLSEIYIPWLAKDVLTVQEADSDPDVYPVNKIIVSNGTLTNNLDGSVSITTGGGGGSGTVSFAQYRNGASADSFTNTSFLNTVTFDSEVVDADSIATLGTNVVNVVSTAYYSITAYVQAEGQTATNWNGLGILRLKAGLSFVEEPKYFPTAAGIAIVRMVAGPIIVNLSSSNDITVEFDNYIGTTAWVTLKELNIIKLS